MRLPYGRPPLLRPQFPVLALAVEQNGIGDIALLEKFPDIGDVFLFFGLGRVDTNNFDALFSTRFLPSAVTRQVP